jgi:hypothetical protein
MVAVIDRRQILLGSVLVGAVLLAALYVAPRPEVEHQSLPERLSDSEFWTLINEFSEPGGTFRSENLVSNESTFQRVIPTLKKQIKPGGVYLGVGPDQNFTYIAALEPKLAFILDIRRQNMLLHLVYKALFELSDNRGEFLSRLFARPMPNGLSATISAEELFGAFDESSSDSEFSRKTLDAILEQLLDRHRFELSADDLNKIEHVYRAFVASGPDIRYSSQSQYSWRRFPSYSELMLETDGSMGRGENHSYLASDRNYQAVKRLQSENRIVPVVGDFAGEKALRSIGRYVRDHGATVSTFYTSNVEFYLFQTEDWKRFFDTVSELPISDESIFIRSYFNNYPSQFSGPPAWLNSPPQSYSLLDSMPSFVAAFLSGQIRNYSDVIRRSRP